MAHTEEEYQHYLTMREYHVDNVEDTEARLVDARERYARLKAPQWQLQINGLQEVMAFEKREIAALDEEFDEDSLARLLLERKAIAVCVEMCHSLKELENAKCRLRRCDAEITRVRKRIAKGAEEAKTQA